MATTPTPPDDPFPEQGDFDTRRDWRDWFARRLEGRSREDCILIAARAALRVLPRLTFDMSEDIYIHGMSKSAKKIILPVMRCHALTLAASLSPASKSDKFSAVEAAQAAIDGGSYAVGVAALAAYAASSAANSVTSFANAAYAIARATTSRSIASTSTAAFEADLARLDGSHAARERLAATPLWLNAEGAPQEILDNWNRFSTQLRALGEGWDVWAEWYGGEEADLFAYKDIFALEDVFATASPGVLQGAQNGQYLFGLPTARALKLWHDVALLPNDLWQGEPAALNARFKELVEEARGEEPNAAPTPIPEPEPTKLTDEELLKHLQADLLGASIVVGDDDRFHIDRSGTNSDRQAWSKPAVPQLHQEALRKLRTLLEPNCAARLSNDPTWSGLAASATLVLDVINQDQEAISTAVGTGWSLSVDLASWLDLDGQLRKSPDGMRDPLAEDVRRPLLSAVETLAVFIRQFPTARHLDEELGAFNTTPDQNAVIGRLVNSIRTAQLLAEEDQQVFEAAHQASQNEGVQANKARGWVGGSLRNVVLKGAKFVTLAYVTGFAGNMAVIHSNKFNDWLSSQKIDITKIFENLPSDKQIAIQEVIRRAKEQGATPSIQKKQD